MRSVSPPLVKMSTAVDTPAYGLNTPDGIETTASSRFSSINFLRVSTCALLEPNSTPSGEMAAHRPPISSRRRNRCKKQQLRLFVAHRQIVADRRRINRTFERRIRQHHVILPPLLEIF